MNATELENLEKRYDAHLDLLHRRTTPHDKIPLIAALATVVDFVKEELRAFKAKPAQEEVLAPIEDEVEKPESPKDEIDLLMSELAGQETTVRTGHGKADWVQIGKGDRKSTRLNSCHSGQSRMPSSA